MEALFRLVDCRAARAFSTRSRAPEEGIRLAHSNLSRTMIDSGAVSEALHLVRLCLR